MKIEYFVIFTAGTKRSLALEHGAVLKKGLYGEDEFTIVSMKDRLSHHNRAAKRAADGTPRFTDEDRFLLWLHQSGENIIYVRAEKASDPSENTAATS